MRTSYVQKRGNYDIGIEYRDLEGKEIGFHSPEKRIWGL